MIDYDSFSRCHLTDIHAGAKESIGAPIEICYMTLGEIMASFHAMAKLKQTVQLISFMSKYRDINSKLGSILYNH